MYLPSYFSESNLAVINDLVVKNHFATLVVILAGEIEVVHVPLYLDQQNNCLLGHIARANQMAKELLRHRQIKVKIIFNGENGYISHNYYNEPEKNVPTWNYATVHIDGILHLVEHHAEIQNLLDVQFGSYENETLDWDLAYLNKLINGIIGIKIEIQQITAKFKLSQNRSIEDREKIIESLLASTDVKQVALGKFMQGYYQS